MYTLIRYQRLYSYAIGIDGIDSTESAWKAFGAYLISGGNDLSAWDEWSGLDAVEIKQKVEEGNTIRKIRSPCLTGSMNVVV
jgi:hypothetical protein